MNSSTKEKSGEGNKLFLIVESVRPNTWLRIWGEMIVAAALASYSNFNLGKFLLTFIATSPLLWGAMYMLNDLTDIHLDKKHPLRSDRPITTGKITTKQAHSVVILFTFIALVIGFSVNYKIFFLLFLLLLSQLSYTLTPFRLKEKFFWDILINGVNSIIRFLLGFFSQVVIHPLPLFPILLFVSIKIIFFLGHRMQNRDLELKNDIRSTVTTLSNKQLKYLVGIICFLTGLFFIISIYLNNFPSITTIAVIIGITPLAVLIARLGRNRIFQQEKTLEFRNLLYLAYFIITNLIAISILFK